MVKMTEDTEDIPQTNSNLFIPDVLVVEVVVLAVEEKELGRFDPRPEANKALWIESGSILFFFFFSLFFLWSFLINQGSEVK